MRRHPKATHKLNRPELGICQRGRAQRQVELVSVKTLRSEARTTGHQDHVHRPAANLAPNQDDRYSRSALRYATRYHSTGCKHLSLSSVCSVSPLLHLVLPEAHFCASDSNREPQEDLGLATIGARGTRDSLLVLPVLCLLRCRCDVATSQSISIALVYRLAKPSHPRHDCFFVDAMFQIRWNSILTTPGHRPLRQMPRKTLLCHSVVDLLRKRVVRSKTPLNCCRRSELSLHKAGRSLTASSRLLPVTADDALPQQLYPSVGPRKRSLAV